MELPLNMENSFAIVKDQFTNTCLALFLHRLESELSTFKSAL